ncbi:MAG: hypothetical protein J6P47_00120 [Acetobacter sp.]|nr:hypothetical protein [Acetobacter sp.]
MFHKTLPSILSDRSNTVLDATETTLPPPWHVHPFDDTLTLIAEMHQRLGF